MKNSIKLIGLLLTMIISFSTVSVFGNISNIADTQNNAITAINETIKPHSFYSSFTGTVKEISKTSEEITKVYLENKDGSQAYFIISENTYFIDDVKINVGTEITGYYESDKPMIMIYPPEYSVDIISPATKDTNIKADKFDGDLLSKDKLLKLNISDDTEILWENDTQIYWIMKPTISDLETVLSNRKLIVFYNATTKSIPAQTNPTKIIVLSAQEDDSVINILVNNTIIDAPPAFLNEDGVVMVPVRAIAETLGYKVGWNNDERSVKIGYEIFFLIGKNNYSNCERTQIKLETAPIIVDGRTYVPLSFFKEILNVKFADFFDNQVIIN